MTDLPQILSGDYLTIFDPLRLHLANESEGMKVKLGHIASAFPNQILPFGFFMQDSPTSPFAGTVIRCPLRSSPSRISDQVVTPEVVSKLFEEFRKTQMHRDLRGRFEWRHPTLGLNDDFSCSRFSYHVQSDG